MFLLTDVALNKFFGRMNCAKQSVKYPLSLELLNLRSPVVSGAFRFLLRHQNFTFCKIFTKHVCFSTTSAILKTTACTSNLFCNFCVCSTLYFSSRFIPLKSKSALILHVKLSIPTPTRFICISILSI